MNKRALIATLAFFAAACAGTAVKTTSVPGGAGSKPDRRAQRRAFYTAPPVIPHEVEDDRDASSCLGCHEEVNDFGDRVSVQTPHPQFTNCTQCHVRSVNPLAKAPGLENGFLGLEEPKQGRREHAQAPPTIPHRLFLRENCVTCHGGENPDQAVRAPHPERSNCRQCHVADRTMEF
jgi:cytochrome c-type protein NapB